MPIRSPPRATITNAALLRHMTDDASKQIAALRAEGRPSAGRVSPRRRRRRRRAHRASPATADEIRYENVAENDRGVYLEFLGLLRNKEHGSELPVLFFASRAMEQASRDLGRRSGQGRALRQRRQPQARGAGLLDGGCAVAGVDLLFQGEFNADGSAAGQSTPREERPRLLGLYDRLQPSALCRARARSVVDRGIRAEPRAKAGTRTTWWASTAPDRGWRRPLAQAGEAVDRAAIDTAGFRFAKLTELDDVNFLPGAVKYGDVPALLALAAPHALWLAGEGSEPPAAVRAAYQAAGQGGAVVAYSGSEDKEPAAAVEWLLKK